LRKCNKINGALFEILIDPFIKFGGRVKFDIGLKVEPVAEACHKIIKFRI